MDKNNLFIDYYVEWRTTDWLMDLFKSNGLEWNDIFKEPEVKPMPRRAPVLNEQNGK